MPELRVHNFSISLDGCASGPSQSAADPFGIGGGDLPSWQLATTPGGVDAAMLQRGVDGIGATIMGRNMFGPIRGAWPDDSWRGWWGDTPPYHHPVFVLSHHPRDPIEFDGGTTFQFVTEGIEAALKQAFDAADGLHVRLGGGANVIRQYVAAGLVDDLHLVVVPTVLGGGEPLFAGGGAGWEQYECVERAVGADVVHVRFTKRSA